MRLEGARVLITGATSGLGRALAEMLIDYKASSIVAIGRNEKSLADLKALGQKKGCKVVPCTLNLNSSDAILRLEAVFASQKEDLPFNLVIACAGVSTTKDLLGLEDLFELERSINVNVRAAAAVLYLGAEGMQKAGCGGNLVAVSSLASLAVLPSSPLYGASKAYLNYYSCALGKALKGSGITVTTVIPGFIKTPMSDRFNGRKTGMVSASKAAAKILTAVKEDRTVLIFPLYLYWGIALLKILPSFVAQRLLKLFAFTVSKDLERTSYEASRDTKAWENNTPQNRAGKSKVSE